MPKAESLLELFAHELKDIADAEAQLLKALPLMAKAAHAPELQQAFEIHLRETVWHHEKVIALLQRVGEAKDGGKCKAMKGLLDEGNDLIKARKPGAVRDAALIAAAQKVERYEISAYGTLRAWAEEIGDRVAGAIFNGILDQEKAADEKLTELAESTINSEAAEVEA